MLSNAYFLAKFRFDTAENEPAKNLQKFANFADPNPLTLQLEQRRQLGVAGLPAPGGPPLRIELAPRRWNRTTGALFRETPHWARPLRRLVKKMMKDSSFFAQGRRYGGE